MRKFIDWNVRLSRKCEALLRFNSNDSIILRALLEGLDDNLRVADVGGGKKPAKRIIGATLKSGTTYDGFDISLEELTQARDQYSGIFQLDLTSPASQPSDKYDVIICLNTLEHVTDAAASIATLSKMLNNGGTLYLKLPSRHAMFEELNLVLPNEFKRKMLHAIFPQKIGDGFPAYYDKSTPTKITAICNKLGLDLQDKNLVKFSSYFTFFFPLYLVWRLITMVQNLVISDYCESFELRFVKSSA